MSDKIDNKIFQSMLTSSDSDATSTWQESHIEKPIIPKNEAFSLSKEKHGLSEEELFDLVEGVTGGPIGSIKSIGALANKIKYIAKLPIKGTKILVDDAAAMILPKPTKEFINKAKNRLFEDLGSEAAWKRWQNTMGAENILGYKAYRSHVKKSLDLFNDKDLKLMDRALADGNMDVLGQFWSQGSKKGLIEINPYRNVTRDLHSTAVHEYAHKAQLAPDYSPTRLTGGSVYKGSNLGIAEDMPYLGNQRPIKFVKDRIERNKRHKGFEWELKYWDKIKPYFTETAKKALPEIEKFAGIDPNVAPKYIKNLRYLLKPREISARIAQLREGNAPAGTIEQLKSILTDEGIEFAKKNLWGAAGIGAFDQMIDSSSDDADNLFKDD